MKKSKRTIEDITSIVDSLPPEGDIDWDMAPGKMVLIGPPPAVIENPSPYRGAVADKVMNKMLREGSRNAILLMRAGAKEQARAQLWSNFVNTCYAIGVPVDTNANLAV